MTSAEVSIDRYLDLIIVSFSQLFDYLTVNCWQQSETLEESFAGFVLEWDESEVHTIRNYEDSMKNLINELNADNMENAFKHYIDVCGNIVSHKQNQMLLQMLEFAIHNNLIPGKYAISSYCVWVVFH